MLPDEPHITSYLLIGRKSSGGFSAKSPEFDFEIEAKTVTKIKELARIKIEQITWLSSMTNAEIPQPKSEPTTAKLLRDNEFLIDVSTVRRYSENPETIYLYRPNDEFILEMILEPYIWFSDSTQFNDPFEMLDVIDFKWEGSEALRDFTHAFHLLRDLFPYLKQFPDANTAYLQTVTKNQDILRQLLDLKVDSLEKAVSQMGIACFSRNYNNVLMWSHYSDKHSGLVLGYSTSELNFGKMHGTDVDYRVHKEKIPAGKIDMEDTNASNMYMARKIATKHPMWAYEQEYRLIFSEKGKVKIPESALKEIYFGLNINTHLRSAICKLIEGKDIDAYQMQKSDGIKLTRIKT